MKRYIELLKRRKDLRKLWLAGMVSQVGDWMSYVAVSLLAIERGTGAVDVALVLLLHTIPGAVLAPFSGAVADRFDRKKVMLVTALAASVVTGLMAWAAVNDWLLGVQMALLLRACIHSLGEPARTASVSQVVDRDELVAAHTLLASSWSVMFTLGMAAGGLLATVGVGFAIGIDAMTFLLAAWFVAGLPSLAPSGSENAESSGRKRSAVKVATAISTAWRVSGQVARLREAVLAKAPLAIAGGGTWLILNLSANRALGVASAALALGVLHAVRGVGTGIGPIIAERVVARSSDPDKARSTALRCAHLIAIAGYALFVLIDQSPVWALVSMLLWGAGAGANWVVSTARIQELSPPDVVGRMVALDELAMIGSMCGSVLVAGLMIDAGVSPATTGWVWIAIGGVASLLLFVASSVFGSSLPASSGRPREGGLASRDLPQG